MKVDHTSETASSSQRAEIGCSEVPREDVYNCSLKR